MKPPICRTDTPGKRGYHEKVSKSVSILGSNIARLRKAKGYSQDDFAAHIGVSRTTIADIERGARGGQLGTLEVIAQALGVSVEDLYQRDPTPEWKEPTARELNAILAKVLAETEALRLEVAKLRAERDDYKARLEHQLEMRARDIIYGDPAQLSSSASSLKTKRKGGGSSGKS